MPGCIAPLPSLLLHPPPSLRRGTALRVAARRGFSPLVAALLEAGAQVDAANEAGVTPLMAASFFGRVPVMRALLDRCAVLGPGSHSLCR